MSRSRNAKALLAETVAELEQALNRRAAERALSGVLFHAIR